MDMNKIMRSLNLHWVVGQLDKHKTCLEEHANNWENIASVPGRAGGLWQTDFCSWDSLLNIFNNSKQISDTISSLTLIIFSASFAKQDSDTMNYSNY